MFCQARLQDHLDIFCVASEDDVDILISGYAFRLRILHEKGLRLLTNQGLFFDMSCFIDLHIHVVINIVYCVAGNGVIMGVSTSDRELFLLGQHSSMINGLQGRYPVYGPVVR